MQHKTIVWRATLILLLCFLIFHPVLVQTTRAQDIPLVENFPENVPEMTPAARAFQLGFYSMAKTLYQQSLNENSINSDEIYQQLATIDLILGEFDSAHFQLKKIQNTTDSTRLLWTLWNISQGNFPENLLEKIDPARLSDLELAWYDVIASDVAERQNNFSRSRDLWKKAQENANNSGQVVALEEFRLTMQLFFQPASEALAERLRTKLRSYNWRPEGFNSVKRYGIVLHRLGRTSDALDILAQQLDHFPPNATPAQAHEFYLLQALLSPRLTAKIEQSLRQTLEENPEVGIGNGVLRILLQQAESQKQRRELLQFLQNIDHDQIRPELQSRLLLGRLQLAMQLEDWTLAQHLIMDLLGSYSQLAERDALITLWIELTLEKTRPDYGEIAVILRQFNEKKPQSTEKTMILWYFAQHFQKKGDPLLASKFYETFFASPPSPLKVKYLIGKMNNDIAMDNINGLEITFNQYLETANIPAVSQLKFLENAIEFLQRQNQWLRAKEWLRQLLIKLPDDPKQDDILFPLLLLEAQNFYKMGNNERAEDSLQELLFLLSSRSKLSDKLFQNLIPRISLLRIQLLQENLQNEEAERLLEHLRNEFPESDAAKKSFFYQAKYFQQRQEIDRAIGELEKFLRIYHVALQQQRNLYAQALLEIAALKTQLPTPQFKEAVALLEQLTQNESDAQDVYYARLQQAKILKQMHDFSSAAMVYENLLHSQPENKERYLLEFYLAKTYLAISDNKPSKTSMKAVNLLEKLHAAPGENANQQIEIDYTLSFAVGKNGQSQKQREMLWEIWQKYALDREIYSQLNPSGLFWLRATGNDLIEFSDPILDENVIAKIIKIINAIN